MKNSSKNTSKLKIGLVFDDTLDSNDGVQQYVKTLGKWLIDQGHEVRFLVGQTHQAGELQPYVRSLSRNVHFSGNQNKMFLPIASSGRHIDAVLKTEQFDILHVMMPTNPLMGSRVVRRSGKTPVIGTFHMVGGTAFINRGANLLARLQKRTLSAIDAFLSVSKAAQAFEEEHFGIQSDVSPNMVDMKAFTQGASQEFLRGSRATIVFLGRLVERKGAIHLLEALRMMHQAGDLKGVRINMCGDGELREELEAYCQEHQLHHHVLFHGFVDEAEKADFLASADIAVFPSTGGEAFGIVLIEAMATARPVVLGGNNAGYATVLGENEQLLFEPENHELLAARLKYFINNPKKRAEVVAWQKKAVRQYDVAVVGADVQRRYRELITAMSRK